jgi:hypothetical protein
MFFFLTFLIAIGTAFCTPQCINHFPKNVGGFIYSTWIIDFEASNQTIYTCGSTRDGGLSGYSLNDYFPLVTASDIQSIQFKWAFVDRSCASCY